MKQVKTLKSMIPDFYLGIIQYIQLHGKLPTDMGSKQKLNYYIRNLKLNRVIVKKGYSVWEVKEVKNLKSKQVKTLSGVTKNIRGHGFVLRVRIPKITNWHNREEYLKSREISYTVSKANWKGYKIILNNFKIWLHDNSIIIYCPKGKSFFEATAEESQNLALYYFEQLLIKIENLLGINLKINKQYQFRIARQHFAKIKDALAHQMNKDQQKIFCYLNNERWLVIDHSDGIDELEAVKKDSAVVDMDRVIVPFMNDLKANYDKTGELILSSEVLNMINKIIHIQSTDRGIMSDLSVNIKTHMEVLNGIKQAVNDLAEQVRKIGILSDKR